ncbi:hypothetical protein Tco_0542341 [Tanacetum coccineum]
MLPWPESVKKSKNLKYERRGLSEPKKEQGEEKQDSTYSSQMKDALDKEVADKVKTTRESMSTKRRRSDSATSGSAQPPLKDDDQSSKKPREYGGPLTTLTFQGVDPLCGLSDSRKRRGPATPEPEWTIPPNDFPEPEINWANTYATTYQVPTENKLQRKMYDIGNPEGHQIPQNINEPLPLGGPPSQVTKSKKLPYPYPAQRLLVPRGLGLEELVPSLWVESEREYDISAVYGITHWPRDLGSYQTKIKHERPNIGCSRLLLNEIIRIVPKPRVVVYRDRNDQRRLMRMKERIHVLVWGREQEDGKKLDHMVKDFHLFEYNKGMETRKWSEDDKRRSKDFITAIEKRLQIRKIFRSLESFVGGRIRDIDYRLVTRQRDVIVVTQSKDRLHGPSDAMHNPP